MISLLCAVSFAQEPDRLLTDDPLALAYNGNRHLVRKPNSETLHLVYVAENHIIYTQSSDGGTSWQALENLGDGKFPAITLDPGHLPSVTWTDDAGGLWYRRQLQEDEWSDPYHLWNPNSVGDLALNSPPSIAIHNSNPDSVHILVTRSGGPPTLNVNHTVEDYAFDVNQPMQGAFVLIEQIQSPYINPPLRSFPSIVRGEADNSLHAVWLRVDTVCYATKPRNGPWDNWGTFPGYYGTTSGPPSVETYGDSIFFVRSARLFAPWVEDVRRASRYLSDDHFGDLNWSETPELKSLYPVNAWGFFTAYTEEPVKYDPFDTYYKAESPDCPRQNISRTSYVNSLYSQSVAKFELMSDWIYTAWQEGDDAPYEICINKLGYAPHILDMAYLTSPNGDNQASPYLVARDSFISDWQIPVDIGNMTTTYQFPLVPGYAYKAKAVAYHEGSGPWSGRIKIDNNLQFAVTYNANVPETLECWIPPALYEDSVLTVSFNHISGDFAAIGPIYIYRYEYEGGRGPMSQLSQPMHNTSIAVFPNPFTENLNITYQIAGQNVADLKLYDVTGRLVKQYTLPSNAAFNHIIWDGVDDHGRMVPQGVYFLHIDNLASGDILCQKVLRIR